MSDTALPAAESQHSSRRPLAIRALNAVGRSLGQDGRSWVSLKPEHLIAKAEQETGLSDWGGEDWRPALDVLVQSLDGEAQLNLMGRMLMKEYLRRLLVNRLKVQADFKAHPEILQVPIKRPVFIVGLPRTGSTLLQRLLSRDPDVRSLQTWEMWYPSPPPQAETYYTDPRIELTRRRLKMLNWSAPDFNAVHEMEAGEPEECISLLQMTLASSCFELMAPIPAYASWLRQQSQQGPYRYYRKLLQLLQSKYEKHHWVLKSPFHLFGIEALMELFPDAVIIQTHREPTKVIPSFSSLYSVMHKLVSNAADEKTLGPFVLDRLADASSDSLRMRERYGEDRFFDVSYRDLLADPFGTVKSIYDRFGYELTPDAANIMKRWHESSPQHKHGVHNYTLEQFGLSAEQVNARFARYRERFGAML